MRLIEAIAIERLTDFLDLLGFVEGQFHLIDQILMGRTNWNHTVF